MTLPLTLVAMSGFLLVGPSVDRAVARLARASAVVWALQIWVRSERVLRKALKVRRSRTMRLSSGGLTSPAPARLAKHREGQ